MKPSERISELQAGVMALLQTENDAKSEMDRRSQQLLATAATVGAIGRVMDDQAEQQRRRFEFLCEAIESGAISGLKERAREEGLL